MKQTKNYVTPLHLNTTRDHLARMIDDKQYCMEVARRYDFDYWDGNRRYGYGGYVYIPGYWKPVAEALIRDYKLINGSKVLDIGCGKAFLLHELLLLLPGLIITGVDISSYAIHSATELVAPFLSLHDANDRFNWPDKEFDLVISIAMVHNLQTRGLETCLSEMARLGKSQYVMTESYRSQKELFNLQCWALTCETFFSPDEWQWMFQKSGYFGDYELIYFS